MDIKKVIKGFDVCLKNIDQPDCPNDCPYFSDCSKCENRVVFQPLMRDALTLLKEQKEQIKNRDESLEKAREEIKWLRGMLKEQEAVEPIPPTDESDLWKCGNCNHQLFRCTHQRYCEMCGHKVKWGMKEQELPTELKQKMWNALYAEEDEYEKKFVGKEEHLNWFTVYRPWLQKGFDIAINAIAEWEGR